MASQTSDRYSSLRQVIGGQPRPTLELLQQARPQRKMVQKRKASDESAEEVAPRVSKRQRDNATSSEAAAQKAPAAKTVAPKKKTATPAAKKAAAAPASAPATKKKTAAAPKKAAAPVKKTTVKTTVTKKTTVAKAKPTTAAAKKAAAKKAAAAAAEVSGTDDDEAAVDAAPAAPKAAKAAPAPKAHKFGKTINQPLTQRLDIYVMGEGGSGELGLGHMDYDMNGNVVEPKEVKRPRINHLLDARTVGVVRMAAGGMHCAAITHDNKILTWGVNDNGALGRESKDTRTDEEREKDEENGDTGLNPNECTPGPVDPSYFPEGTVFTDICCSDSATFVVTQDGSVYGWGTFRKSEGIIGFSHNNMTKEEKWERFPVLVPELKKIKSVVAGQNHILAVDIAQNVFAWGCGQQNQLGRRIVERTSTGSLVPREFGLPRGKTIFVNSGEFHSFAIDTKNQVRTWGLNNHGQTGISSHAGEDNAVIPNPTLVKSLLDYKIVQMAGGNHHSLALTDDGKVLAFGRSDAYQLGVDVDALPKDIVVFENGDHRMVTKPVEVPGIKACFIAAGTDNSFAITDDGKVYSWGFNANYQTGQGKVDEVEEATLIDNSAVRGKKITWAAGGGQFSVLAGPADL